MTHSTVNGRKNDILWALAQLNHKEYVDFLTSREVALRQRLLQELHKLTSNPTSERDAIMRDLAAEALS